MARSGGVPSIPSVASVYNALNPVQNWLKDLRYATECYDSRGVTVAPPPAAGTSSAMESNYQRLWELGPKSGAGPTAVLGAPDGAKGPPAATGGLTHHRKAPDVPTPLPGKKPAADSGQSALKSSGLGSKDQVQVKEGALSKPGGAQSHLSAFAKERSATVGYSASVNANEPTSKGVKSDASSVSASSSTTSLKSDNKYPVPQTKDVPKAFVAPPSTTKTNAPQASPASKVKPQAPQIPNVHSQQGTPSPILRSVPDTTYPGNRYSATYSFAERSQVDASRNSPEAPQGERGSQHLKRYSSFLERERAKLITEIAISKAALAKGTVGSPQVPQDRPEDANPGATGFDRKKGRAPSPGQASHTAGVGPSVETNVARNSSFKGGPVPGISAAGKPPIDPLTSGGYRSSLDTFGSHTLPLRKSYDSSAQSGVQRSQSDASKVEVNAPKDADAKIILIRNENFGANEAIREDGSCPVKLNPGEVKKASEIVAFCNSKDSRKRVASEDVLEGKGAISKGTSPIPNRLSGASSIKYDFTNAPATLNVAKDRKGETSSPQSASYTETPEKSNSRPQSQENAAKKPAVPKRTDSAEKLGAQTPQSKQSAALDSPDRRSSFGNRPAIPKRTDSLKENSVKQDTKQEIAVQKPVPAKRTIIPANTHIYVNLDSLKIAKGEEKGQGVASKDQSASLKRDEMVSAGGNPIDTSTYVSTAANSKHSETTEQREHISGPQVHSAPLKGDAKAPGGRNPATLSAGVSITSNTSNTSPYVNIDTFNLVQGHTDSPEGPPRVPGANSTRSKETVVNPNLSVNIDNESKSKKTIETPPGANPPYVNLDTFNKAGGAKHSTSGTQINASPYVNIDSLNIVKGSGTHGSEQGGANVVLSKAQGSKVDIATGNAKEASIATSKKESASKGDRGLGHDYENVKITAANTVNVLGRVSGDSTPPGANPQSKVHPQDTAKVTSLKSSNTDNAAKGSNVSNTGKEICNKPAPKPPVTFVEPPAVEANNNCQRGGGGVSTPKGYESRLEDIEKVSKFIGAKSRALELVKVNHGQICRLSFDFEDTVDELFANAECLQCLDFSLRANVLQWQTELLFECSSEEDEMQDFVSSLESINEKRMTGNLKSPTNSLPPRIICPDDGYKSSNEDIIIREKSPDRRNEERAKTSCFDEMRKNEELESQRYTNIKYIYENKDKRKHSGINVSNEKIIIYFIPQEKDVCLFDIQNLKPISKKELVFNIHGEDSTIKFVFDSQADLMQIFEDIGVRLEKKLKKSTNSLDVTDKPEKSQIKSTLLKLLGKRSKRDLLERKGIIQNEAIFGNTLNKLYEKFGTPVPRFVTEVIALIELKENITSMGLYRASGNLATMQKIRFDVDMHKYDSLEQYQTEIDVLTGSLKMFFRELKEPLLPYETYKKLLEVYDDKKSNVKKFEKIKHLLKQLPDAHYKTLICLIQHLINVEANKIENKMDTYNLSICWGPTLTWPSADDSKNESLFTTSTSSSKVVEMLLQAYASELKAAKGKEAVIQELKSKTHLDSRDDPPGPVDSNRQLNKDGIFGSSLELLCQDSKTNVPEFVTKMIDLIEKNSTAVGIYRVSGNITKVEKIKRKVNKNKLRYLDEHKHEVFELAGAFKLFFRELHGNLLPPGIFENLILACCEPNPNEQYITITKQLDRLTPCHRDTLAALLRHLVKVSKDEHTNRMSVSNLAQIWGPTVMYPCFGQKAEDSKNVLDMLMRYQMAEMPLVGDQIAPMLSPNDSSLHRRSLMQSQQRKSLYSPSDGGKQH